MTTAGSGKNAQDVLLRRVTEAGGQMRFEVVLSSARINDASNWSSFGVDANTWQGLQFGGNAGLNLHYVSMSAAPTYNAAGALTSFAPAGSFLGEGVFTTDPTGVQTIITQPCQVSSWVGIGNLVWNDHNNNGLKDTTESGS